MLHNAIPKMERDHKQRRADEDGDKTWLKSLKGDKKDSVPRLSRINPDKCGKFQVPLRMVSSRWPRFGASVPSERRQDLRGSILCLASMAAYNDKLGHL